MWKSPEIKKKVIDKINRIFRMICARMLPVECPAGLLSEQFRTGGSLRSQNKSRQSVMKSIFSIADRGLVPSWRASGTPRKRSCQSC